MQPLLINEFFGRFLVFSFIMLSLKSLKRKLFLILIDLNISIYEDPILLKDIVKKIKNKYNKGNFVIKNCYSSKNRKIKNKFQINTMYKFDTFLKNE